MNFGWLVSTYVVCERLSVMHKQVSVQLTSNSKFLSKFSRKSLSGISDQKALPPNEKLQIWDDQSLLQNTHPNEKLQIWDDQSLLTPPTPQPPKLKNFKFEITKVYSGIPPPPKWKTSDLRWPKLTPEYPPPQLKNFRFEMTKVYSRIPPQPPNPPPPQIEKLQIWDYQGLLWNTPSPKMKNFRFEMTKAYSRIPPSPIEKLQIWDYQGLLWNSPLNEKLQIWDDQSLLQNPPQTPLPQNWKTSDLRLPRFIPEYPPPQRLGIREILCGDYSVSPVDTTRSFSIDRFTT